MVGGDRQDAKRVPAEKPLVLLGRVCGEIRAHLSREAGLRELAGNSRPADYRHRAAVDLDEEVAAPTALKVEGEGEIGHHADLPTDALVREGDTHRERFAGATLRRGRRGDHLVRMYETHVATIARRVLQRHVEVDDLQLVLDERPAGFAVLAASVDVGESDPVVLDQKTRSAIGEPVHERCGLAGRVIVELGARSIDVAVMEEF